MRDITGCIVKENCKRYIYKSRKNMMFTPIKNTKEKFKCDTYLKYKIN